MFWIITAILLLIALAFVFPALFRKKNDFHDGQREQNIFIANEQLADLEARLKQGEIDKEDYQATRDELERSLFSDVNEADDSSLKSNTKTSLLSTILITLLIPAIAIPVYLKVGNLVFTDQLDSKKAAIKANNVVVPRKADGTPDIDRMVAGLQQKMENDPKNAKGWYMLGRSYMVLKRYPPAVKAFDRAHKLRPKSVNIMLSLADALSMENGGDIAKKSSNLIDKAIALEPNNQTALWLGGMSARQSGNNYQAIERWNKVLGLLQDPQERDEVKSLIRQASKKLSPEQKQQLSAVIEIANDANAQGNDSVGISVTVSISDKIKDKVKPTDTVFIYAKAMSGPPMPLAATKFQVSDLPVVVILNDQMAMMPTMKLSDYSEVIVGARVSKSGGPIPKNGDLYSEKSSIKTGANVQLSIDTLLVK